MPRRLPIRVARGRILVAFYHPGDGLSGLLWPEEVYEDKPQWVCPVMRERALVSELFPFPAEARFERRVYTRMEVALPGRFIHHLQPLADPLWQCVLADQEPTSPWKPSPVERVIGNDPVTLGVLREIVVAFVLGERRFACFKCGSPDLVQNGVRMECEACGDRQD